MILDVHFSWADKLDVHGYDDLPGEQTPLYFGSYTAAPKALDGAGAPGRGDGPDGRGTGAGFEATRCSVVLMTRR